MNSFQKHFLVPLKILFFKKSIYKKYIKNKFEIEIAFLEGPITRIFSIKNLNSKKIAWIHNDISSVFGKGIKAKIKRKIDQKIYNQYQELIFVSEQNLKDFENIYSNIKTNKRVIYNYINPQNILEKAEQKIELPFSYKVLNFLTVARLVEQKGIERLIEVHTKLIKDGFNHNFYVIGDGPLKAKLENKIKENNIRNTFFLLGKKENPYPYIKNSDYFCLFSYFEGYGMAIEEAKILNKPILITNTAAREAVKLYPNYRIAENTSDGIYNVIKEAVLNKEENIKNTKYENDELIEQIKELLEEK